MDEDTKRDIAIRIVNEMVKAGLVRDCTDTDCSDEFDWQDKIVEIINDDGMSKIEKMTPEERAELDRLLHEDEIDKIDPEVLAEVDAGMEEMDAAEKRGRDWYRRQPLTITAKTLFNEDPLIVTTIAVKPYDYGYIVSLQRYVEGRIVEYSTKTHAYIDIDNVNQGKIMHWLLRTNRIMKKV